MDGSTLSRQAPSRLAYDSKVVCYRSGQTRWTEVNAHADGSFSVTRGWEMYDRNGDRDYGWASETFAGRDEAFAAAGLVDPALARAA